jgi:hypothetical protein
VRMAATTYGIMRRFFNLCPLWDAFIIVKLGRMKTAGCISFFREVRNAYRILLCKPHRNSHLEDVGVNRRSI